MTTATDTSDENEIYELLPAVFRQQDIAQGYPLLALTKVFDQIRAQLAAGIAELEQDWFIQTCPLDYVPLIGGLLGVEIAKPVRPEHRALVADTLGFRRRKGIAAALPKHLRDSSGWYSLYSPGAATPWPAWPLADAIGPVTESAGLLRVWRLPAFAMVGATPAAAATANYYHFNPLGMDQPLFNLPNTPLDWVAAPPVTALPTPITAAMLAADLVRYDEMWPQSSEVPPNSLLYGPARGLVIRTQDTKGLWTAVLPGQVRAMALAGYPPVAPDYPALEGGAIDLASVKAGICALTITLGDATAALTVDVPATPTMTDLVALLQNAIETAIIVPGKRVTAAAVKALEVGAVGTALVLVPGMAATEQLTIGPTSPGGADPLRLVGSARLGIAAATLKLTPALIGLLTGAPPSSVMTFTAPAGQVLSVPLPFALDPPTPTEAAKAFAAALPTCFVCDAGDQVVIVPPSTALGSPVPATPPAPALGLVAAVAIDPELGLFHWPTSWGAPGTLSVDYGLAMPGPIGGVGSRPLPPVPANAVVLKDGGDPDWLEQQLGAWSQSKAVATALTLQGSATRAIASQTLAPTAGQSLWIVGAAGSQPYVVIDSPGTLKLLGPAPPADRRSLAMPGTIVMSGVALAGSIALLGGDIDLSLLDMTLYPGAGALALTATAAHDAPPPQPGAATLALNCCILGPADLTLMSGRIEITGSVLCALPVPDPAVEVLTLPAAVSAKFVRLTLIGASAVGGKLDAADSLFDGLLACSGEVYFTNCYVRDLHYGPAGDPHAGDADTAAPASVTRCGTCGKVRRIRLVNSLLRQLAVARGSDFCSCEEPSDGETRNCTTCTDPACADRCPLRAPGQSWEIVQEPPRFVEPNAYPLPNLARLSEHNPKELLAGASNHDVLGAYNLSVPTARLNQFEAALSSALLLGTRLGRRFES
jgi:hypothetical protein